MKLILCLFIFLLSCSDSSFKKVEALDSFRLLAVISNVSEVNPGDSVNLQLLISDTKGSGRVITGSVKSCVDPGIALGATLSCNHDPFTQEDTYSFNTVTDADLGAANLYTGVTDQVLTITTPANVLDGLSDRIKTNGLGYISIFQFVVDNVEHTIFKRTIITQRNDLNALPSVTNILLNGEVIGDRPQKNDQLSLNTSLPESYTYIGVNGLNELRTETFYISWYVSQGSFDKPKTFREESTKYLDDPGGDPFLIVAILRDSRGGVTFVRRVYP